MDRLVNGLPIFLANIINIYSFIILIYCVLSFFPALYNSAFGVFIRSMVQPFLNLISRIIPTRVGFLDISPVIAFIILEIISGLILRFL
ncbi:MULTISPECIES: YggT family protein [Lactobacillaceae]|uniref:YggT family protein n=1 Tax=Lactobacillaceae TaxID=33958 RepID=UPI000C1B7288|nr:MULTISPECIES: YggT family protein [Lactobacillaceae]